MPLRPVTEQDLPIFFEHQRDTEAARMAAFPPRERDAFMKHWREKVLGNPENLARTIVTDGQVAGNIGAFTDEGRRMVGYWIGREQWGKGIATSALADLLREETTRPIYAWVADHNSASMRVLEKCGFVRSAEPGGRHDDCESIVEFLFTLT